MTSDGKTYTNAIPLNSLKHWQSVGYLLGPIETVGGSVGKPVGGVEKSRWKIMCPGVEKPVGKGHASHSRSWE